MFMFVFSVVMISLVSLFLQVVISLGAFLSAQQVGMAQEMNAWHNMAYEYACTNATGRTIMGGPSVAANLTTAQVTSMRPTSVANPATTYAGNAWTSFVFQGTFGAAPNVRMVATYIGAGATASGFSAGAVGAQLQKLNSMRNNSYNFGAVQVGAPRKVNLTIYHGAAGSEIITIDGIPAADSAGGAIPASSIMLISNAQSCL